MTNNRSVVGIDGKKHQRHGEQKPTDSEELRSGISGTSGSPVFARPPKASISQQVIVRVRLAQADQTSRFSRDSPGLEPSVPKGYVRDTFMSRFAESHPGRDREHHL